MSIILHNDRDEAKADELQIFRRRLPGYKELPDVIRDAASHMCIRGFGAPEEDAPAFAADVLSFEVIGDVDMEEEGGNKYSEKVLGKPLLLQKREFDAWVKNASILLPGSHWG